MHFWKHKRRAVNIMFRLFKSKKKASTVDTSSRWDDGLDELTDTASIADTESVTAQSSTDQDEREKEFRRKLDSLVAGLKIAPELSMKGLKTNIALETHSSRKHYDNTLDSSLTDIIKLLTELKKQNNNGLLTVPNSVHQLIDTINQFLAGKSESSAPGMRPSDTFDEYIRISESWSATMSQAQEEFDALSKEYPCYNRHSYNQSAMDSMAGYALGASTFIETALEIISDRVPKDDLIRAFPKLYGALQERSPLEMLHVDTSKQEWPYIGAWCDRFYGVGPSTQESVESYILQEYPSTQEALLIKARRKLRSASELSANHNLDGVNFRSRSEFYTQVAGEVFAQSSGIGPISVVVKSMNDYVHTYFSLNEFNHPPFES